MTPLLTVEHIDCHYQTEAVVHDLSLHLYAGELACLLGSSGCGKTTTLRAIAGFEPLKQGKISLNGEIISMPNYTLPPEKRQIGMVFQDYALFPHLTVFENVCFGLRGKNLVQKEAAIKDLLAMTGLVDLQNRYPHELSGGQQQRVALARALAPRPALMLLDEPFSNLDIALRERLSVEVRDILKKQGTTALMVTHDQQEAFAIADKIGVMQQGRIVQWDTAFMLYHEPINRFVADFIGQGTFIRGKLVEPETIETELGELTGNRAYPWTRYSLVDVLLRPDDILPDPASPLRVNVANKAFKGAQTLYTLKLASGQTVLSLFPSHHDYSLGSEVGIRVITDHLVAFHASEH